MIKDWVLNKFGGRGKCDKLAQELDSANYLLSEKSERLARLTQELDSANYLLSENSEQLARLAKELDEAKAKIPAVSTPERPLELVYTDVKGQKYYGFASEDALTTWRAEGIFRVANNQMLGVSDLDISQHEQAQNALFVQTLAAKEPEKAGLMQQFFYNSARLQERLSNAGGYATFKEIAKLVMVLEDEPLEFAKVGPYWDEEKERRLAEDPQLLGFFLPRAAMLNEVLKGLEKSGQLDYMIQTLSLLQD
jgi:hypothetical protein